MKEQSASHPKNERRGTLCRQFSLIRQGIRKEKLPYMLLFALAPIFPGMKNSLVAHACPLFGMDPVFLMGIAFSLGIGLLFVFLKAHAFKRYFRFIAVLTVMNLVLWLILPRGIPATLIGLCFSLLLGGIAGFQLFGFSYALTSLERLLGAAFTVLFSLLFQAFLAVLPLGMNDGLIYVVLQVLLSAAGLFMYQEEHFVPPKDKSSEQTSKPLTLALFFFFAHRGIVFFHSYLPHNTAQMIYVLSGLLALVLSLVIYFLLMFNIWHMCNMFFSGMAIASLLHLLLPNVQGGGVSGFLEGFSYMGFIASYYLLGEALNRHAGFGLFKRILFVIFNAALLLHIVPALIASLSPSLLPLINVIVTAGLFILFTLLMPVLSGQLFIKPVHTETSQERLDRLTLQYQLTSREKEVVDLLIKGYLYKQCASKLNISLDTVKFHAKNAYRKAGVTTRGELTALFLEQPFFKPENKE